MRTSLFALLALLVAAPAAAQSFGGSAAVHDDAILFGQAETDREPGAVFVFRPSGDGFERAARLTAGDAVIGDRFGATMALSGDRLLVGAPRAENGAGAAYVFERTEAGEWRQVARLVPSRRDPADQFGIELGFAGDLALVAIADGDSARGSVFAFRRGGAGWALDRELAPPEGIGNDEGFGRTLAVIDGAPVVAAAGADSGQGAVWVWPAGGGEAVRIDGTVPGGRFGAGATVAEGDLLVGAPGTNQARGEVTVFRRNDAGAWAEVARLNPGEAATPQTLFGATMATYGDEVWIGAPGANGFRGQIHVFKHEDGAWVQDQVLEAPNTQPGGFFAGSIAVGDDRAAIGVPGEDYGAGVGAIFVDEDEGWTFDENVSIPVEPLQTVTGEEVECAAGRAAGFECRDVTLLSFLPVQSIGGARGVELNDIWGWTDPETGREIAIVGRVDGTSFVDVTDPQNPIYLGDLPKTEGSPGAAWRDMKVYEDHAFIVADNSGEHGMQVFDLTRLRNLQNAPVTFTPDTTYHRINSAHNIVINVESGFAYTVGNGNGGETCGGGLHMIDIRDPKNPTFAGCFSDPTTGREKTGYTHDAQCVIYRGPDEEHRGREICFGSNETALSIADVTDKSAPVALSMAEYPNVGYTHQAWLTDDQKYLLMDDELDELNGYVDHTRTLIWDVSDLDDPVLVKEYLNPNSTAIDHNLYVKGDKVFQSNYVQGLRILDISDIVNPEEVGFFDTVPYGDNSPRFDGSWSNYPYFDSGIIVVTSGDEGLFLLRYTPTGDRPIS